MRELFVPPLEIGCLLILLPPPKQLLASSVSCLVFFRRTEHRRGGEKSKKIKTFHSKRAGSVVAFASIIMVKIFSRASSSITINKRVSLGSSGEEKSS